MGTWNTGTLIGQRFNKLVVISLAEKAYPSREGRIWICKCDCGETTRAQTYALRRGKMKSCGCSKYDHLYQNLIGQKFGSLTITEKLGLREDGRIYWKCRCKCGNEHETNTSLLTRGNTRSCGCSRKAAGIARRLPDSGAAKNLVIRMYKVNAKARNHEFTLTDDEMICLMKQNCHYCNTKPATERETRHKTGKFVYNGLDRKDNSEGYTINNIVPCCRECNFKKGSTDYEEFIKWVLAVADNIRGTND